MVVSGEDFGEDVYWPDKGMSRGQAAARELKISIRGI